MEVSGVAVFCTARTDHLLFADVRRANERSLIDAGVVQAIHRIGEDVVDDEGRIVTVGGLSCARVIDRFAEYRKPNLGIGRKLTLVVFDL